MTASGPSSAYSTWGEARRLAGAALNTGIAAARGEAFALMIDGATS